MRCRINCGPTGRRAACELGLLRLSADKVSRIFGWRVTKRLGGKLETVLEKIEPGHHVLRAYSKKAVLRRYQKWRTFLRVEVLSNPLKDFGRTQGLENCDAVWRKRRANRPLRRLRSPVAPDADRLPAVPALGLAHRLWPQPRPRHQDPQMYKDKQAREYWTPQSASPSNPSLDQALVS